MTREQRVFHLRSPTKTFRRRTTRWRTEREFSSAPMCPANLRNLCAVGPLPSIEHCRRKLPGYLQRRFTGAACHREASIAVTRTPFRDAGLRIRRQGVEPATFHLSVRIVLPTRNRLRRSNHSECDRDARAAHSRAARVVFCRAVC